jgi:hypothetical protein
MERQRQSAISGSTISTGYAWVPIACVQTGQGKVVSSAADASMSASTKSDHREITRHDRSGTTAAAHRDLLTTIAKCSGILTRYNRKKELSETDRMFS